MENKIFNFNNHEISVVLNENNEPLFIAKEVCEILQYSDTEVALRKLDDDEKLTRKVYVSGQNRNVNVITESGLYSLVLRSNKPEAKVFKKWVTSELLPTIRKTGKYETKNKVPENYGEALIEAGRLALANQQLQIDNNRMKPRDEFVTKVFETTDLVDIGEVAKILNLAYGRNTLYSVLREKGILFKSKNEPYQEFIAKGYFTLKPYLVEKTVPPQTKIQTFATQKGLGFIAKILGVVHIPENRLNLV